MAPLYGLTIDHQGSVFVTDNGNTRVQKFDGNGNFILLWGNFGTANGISTTLRESRAMEKVTCTCAIPVTIACRNSMGNWANTS